MTTRCFIFFAGLLSLIACQKHKTAEDYRQNTLRKMQGKWMVDSTVTELYEPIPSFKEKSVYKGATTDSVIFANGVARNYCDTLPFAASETYDLVNYHQIGWGQNFWYITQIDASKMVVEKDANYVDQNQRKIQRFYFSKYLVR